jgi:hypothetical protein
MKVQYIRTAARFALMSSVVVSLIVVRDCGRPLDSRSRKGVLVDMRFLQTAQAMAHLASTPDERDFSGQVIKLADHELDLAFSTALREAILHPAAAATPEAEELAARVNKAESRVKADEDQVELFKAQITKVKGPQQQALQQQLEVLEAQLALDQDELQDAREDLSRASGDMAERIKSMWEKHRAASQEHGSAAQSVDPTANSAEAGYDAGNLIAQVAAWYALSHKTKPLMQARQDLLQGSNELSLQHDKLEALAENLAVQNRPQQNSKGADSSEGADVARLTAMQRQATTQRTLVDITQRTDDRREMSNTYDAWISFIQARTRVAMTGVLQSAIWIFLIMLVAPPAARIVEGRMAKRRPEDQRWTNLSATAGFGMQALGVLLCLMVVFGFPQQLPTAIFGLVGAGVTVALKDVTGFMIDDRIRGLLNANPKPGVSSEKISQP